MQTFKKYEEDCDYLTEEQNETVPRQITVIFDEDKDKERILAHKRVCEYNNKKYERIDGLITLCSMSPIIIIFLSGFLIYCLLECFDIKIIVGLCVFGISCVLIILLSFKYIDKLKSYAGSSFQMEACDKKIKEINNLSKACNDKCKVEINANYKNFLCFFLDGVEKFSFHLDSEIPDGDFYVTLRRYSKEEDCCVHHTGDFKWVAVTSLNVEDNCDIKDVRMQTDKDIDNIFEESMIYKLKKKIVSF